MTAEGLHPRRAIDPRIYQILTLARSWSTASPASTWRSGGHRLRLLATALLTQYAGTRLARLPAFDPKSALISGFPSASFCAPTLSAGRSSRRGHDRQQIRPKGARQARLEPDESGHRGDDRFHRKVWVSPGQWGNAAFLAFLFACLGGLVVNRAERSDVTYAFSVSIWAPLRSRPLAGAAVRHSAPSAVERRFSPLHVFHDLRPADDPRFARRPHPLRGLVALGAERSRLSSTGRTGC